MASSPAPRAEHPRGERSNRTVAVAVAIVATVGTVLFASSRSDVPAPPSDGLVDPATAGFAEGWTRLPLPPEVRDGAALVWTGDELLAWGGCATDVEDRCDATADGYAFDPDVGTWRTLPKAPLASGRTHAAWTGERAIFLRLRAERRVDGVAFDPATGSWQRIPRAPVRAEYGATEVWTGSELIVFGGGEPREPAAGADAAYDPATGRWRVIAAAPVELNASTGMWTGREALLFGSLLDRRNRASTPTSVGAAYDPRKDRWRELPASDLSPQATSAVWVDGRMVAWDYEVHSQEFDPRRDTWSKPMKMPLDFSECYPASAAVRGLVFAFFCGHIALYEPDEGTWTEVHGGPADEEVWSKAYERYLKLWRFAELVPAGNVLFVQAQGITLNAKGVACYGCDGARESLWAYRPPATPSDQRTAPPVSPASAYRVAEEFMRARALDADGPIRRLIVPAAAAKFGSPHGVPEPLVAGTWYSVHRPTALPGQPASFEVPVEITLKGRIGQILGRKSAAETLVIGPGRTLAGRRVPLAVLDVRPG